MSDEDDERAADEAVKRQVHDAIAEVLDGTDWVPGEGAVMAHSVTIVGWIYPTGESATSCIASGPHYAVRGLLEEGLQHMVNAVDAMGVEYDGD